MSCVPVAAKDEARDPVKKIARPMRRITLRDQMSDKRPYSSCPVVDVLSMSPLSAPEAAVGFLNSVRHSHEVSVRDPGSLIAGAQGVSDDVQTRGQGSLVHEGHEVDAGTGQEDLDANEL